jgi:hypothetical protein
MSWSRDAAHFDELLSRRFDDGGPMLVAAKIDEKPRRRAGLVSSLDSPGIFARDSERS